MFTEKEITLLSTILQFEREQNQEIGNTGTFDWTNHNDLISNRGTAYVLKYIGFPKYIDVPKTDERYFCAHYIKMEQWDRRQELDQVDFIRWLITEYKNNKKKITNIKKARALQKKQ